MRIYPKMRKILFDVWKRIQWGAKSWGPTHRRICHWEYLLTFALNASNIFLNRSLDIFLIIFLNIFLRLSISIYHKRIIPVPATENIPKIIVLNVFQYTYQYITQFSTYSSISFSLYFSIFFSFFKRFFSVYFTKGSIWFFVP